MDVIRPGRRRQQWAMIWVMLVLGMLTVPLSGEPIISEFLAATSNDGLLDEDGEASDWLEIYNPGDEAVDLGGYSLSDDVADLSKWKFPSPTLLGGQQYLVAFASGKDRSVAGSELHTNFRLGASGESLILVAQDGVSVVSAIESYSAQQPGVSFGFGVSGATFNRTLVQEGAACRWLVPDQDKGNAWRSGGFDDSQWSAGATGVGYGYDGLVGEGGDSEDDMRSKNASIYVRIPFQLSQPGNVVALKLRMKYEDGFAAFLNGKKIAAANAPIDLLWNSRATTTNRDTDAVIFEDFNLAFADQLSVGENVLAIHGLNASPGGSDLLLLPQLEVEERRGQSEQGYFLTPSPGSVNGARTDGFVASLSFSHQRGFYEKPLDLVIRTDTEEATIRYTEDGSVPTSENGVDYVAPIQVDSTSVIRAIAFRSGWEPSTVETYTYIFPADVLTQDQARATSKGLPTRWASTSPDYDMDPDVVEDPEFAEQLIPALKKIPTVSLVTSADDLFGSKGVYSNPQGTGLQWERGISMEIIDLNTGGSHQMDCGFELKGELSDRLTSRKRSPFDCYSRGSMVIRNCVIPCLVPMVELSRNLIH